MFMFPLKTLAHKGLRSHDLMVSYSYKSTLLLTPTRNSVKPSMKNEFLDQFLTSGASALIVVSACSVHAASGSVTDICRNNLHT